MLLRPVALATAAMAMMSLPGSRADAAFVTYTETATASGTLGSLSFTNALVTLTQTADTSNVVFSDLYYGVQAVTSTVTVAGLGTASFATPTLIAYQPSGYRIGLASGTVGSTASSILSEVNFSLPPYDLRSSLGPVSGTPLYNAGSPFATTLGDLVLSSVSGPVTFQASAGAAVPEPSSLALCGVAGTVVLAVARMRRRRARTPERRGRRPGRAVTSAW